MLLQEQSKNGTAHLICDWKVNLYRCTHVMYTAGAYEEVLRIPQPTPLGRDRAHTIMIARARMHARSEAQFAPAFPDEDSCAGQKELPSVQELEPTHIAARAHVHVHVHAARG